MISASESLSAPTSGQTDPSASSDFNTTPQPPRAPVVGDIVHVPLDRGVNTGACRAALVVRVWNDRLINAQLFADNVNDHEEYRDRNPWLTSLPYAPPSAARPSTWHYIGEDIPPAGVTAALVVPVTEASAPATTPATATAASDGTEVPGVQPAVDEQASTEA